MQSYHFSLVFLVKITVLHSKSSCHWTGWREQMQDPLQFVLQGAKSSPVNSITVIIPLWAVLRLLQPPCYSYGPQGSRCITHHPRLPTPSFFWLTSFKRRCPKSWDVMGVPPIHPFIDGIPLLVGGLEHECYFPFHLWDNHPSHLTNSIIFQRGRVGIPPTR